MLSKITTLCILSTILVIALTAYITLDIVYHTRYRNEIAVCIRISDTIVTLSIIFMLYKVFMY